MLNFNVVAEIMWEVQTARAQRERNEQANKRAMMRRTKTALDLSAADPEGAAALLHGGGGGHRKTRNTHRKTRGGGGGGHRRTSNPALDSLLRLSVPGMIGSAMGSIGLGGSKRFGGGDAYHPDEEIRETEVLGQLHKVEELNRAKSKKPGLIREATTGVAPGMVKRGSLMAVKAIGPEAQIAAMHAEHKMAVPPRTRRSRGSRPS